MQLLLNYLQAAFWYLVMFKWQVHSWHLGKQRGRRQLVSWLSINLSIVKDHLALFISALEFKNPYQRIFYSRRITNTPRFGDDQRSLPWLVSHCLSPFIGRKITDDKSWITDLRIRMEETMTTWLKDSCWVVVPGYRYLLLHTYTKQIFIETMWTERKIHPMYLDIFQIKIKFG